MKLLNILGAVIAVHIAVLVLAIMIPGCRSTGAGSTEETRAPGAVYPAPASSSPISAASGMSDADLNPPLAGDVPSSFDPNAPATGSSGGSFRVAPTRPSTPVTDTYVAEPLPEPASVPAETYTVQRGDNLWTLAKRNGLTVRELASANGLPADAGLRVGQVLIIPGRVIATPDLGMTEAGSAAPSTGTAASYTIRPGDTLGKIAQAHGTTVRELKAFNRLTSDMVRAGDTLAIPESATVAPPVVEEEEEAPATPATPAGATAYRHTVAPGESLTVIANRYGVRIGDIALANKIRDPSLIRPGQELVIPGWEAPAANPEPETPITTLGGPPAAAPAETSDLDAALEEEDLSNIPVLRVDGDVPTIGGDDESSSSPPVFE